MKRWALTVLAMMAGGLAFGAVAEPYQFVGNWSVVTSTTATVFYGDGSQLSGLSTIPAHFLVPFPALTSCPSGYAEYVATRGRALVGRPAAGTLGGTIGTALTDQENRATGQHTHVASTVVTDPGHGHTAVSSIVPNPHDHTTGEGGSLAAGSGGFSFITGHSAGATTGGTALTATTTMTNTVSGLTAGTTVNNNAGGVAGTNAPYLQSLICEKQ